MSTDLTEAALSESQAKKLCDKIRSQAENLRQLLRELYDGKGWISLGYRTWADCCQEEFGYSKRHANRLLQAESIGREVGPIGPTLPESHARELAAVPADQPKGTFIAPGA